LKQLFYIFIFFVLSFKSFGQESDSLEWIEKGELGIGSNEIWSVDLLGNIYIAKKSIINKYDSTGILKFSQSIKSIGRLQDIQAINTMKVVAFSEEQQSICIMDNTLTLSEECLDLSKFNIGNASLIAVSGQSDKIWVVDQLNSKLLLLSLNGTDQFQEIKNLQGILNISQIVSIQEVNNQLFLMDSNNEIFQFDIYGSLINRYTFENLKGFVVKGSTLVALLEDRFVLASLEESVKKIIEIPVKRINEVKISGNFFYFRTENKILKYSLFLHQ